jgi:two-component system nitrogen regulation response regulator GlnG
MAAGREVLKSDLPPELLAIDTPSPRAAGDWEQSLRRWIGSQLASGARDILATATPAFERAAIETALEYTAGRKRDAAELLGWGRNTLTRKIQELGIADDRDSEA